MNEVRYFPKENGIFWVLHLRMANDGGRIGFGETGPWSMAVWGHSAVPSTEGVAEWAVASLDHPALQALSASGPLEQVGVNR